MRLAWFSPMPPVRSGVAGCSAELVASLAPDHEIDVYVHRTESGPWNSAHDYVWRHRQAPYDLTVYQLGNSSNHDYLWPYLFRFPGLAVLHDVHLHHARAAHLLRERRADDYRAEFAASEPDVNPDAAELAVAGFDSHLLYDWPFVRLVASVSRMSAVHSRLLRDTLAQAHPGAAIEHIRLGHGTLVPPEAGPARRLAARRTLHIPPDAILFGCFGALTPDKRVPQILDAFEALLPHAPRAWLLLAGSPAAHYDIAADVRRRQTAGHVVTTGYVASEEELTDCIVACDVTLNLRWPTAREVSGPWLRCLAAGRPSVVIDLAHTADVPTLDPRTWTASGDGSAPVSVAIDIVDEDHSLRLAMYRLARDAALRETLGHAAQAWWIREHSQQAMVEDYRRIIPLAAARPAPAAALPGHLQSSESEVMVGILDRFGLPVPWSRT
jgi:glycosyltransferase involved in cell wall biosynthesis